MVAHQDDLTATTIDWMKLSDEDTELVMDELDNQADAIIQEHLKSGFITEEDVENIWNYIDEAVCDAGSEFHPGSWGVKFICDYLSTRQMLSYRNIWTS